MKTRNEINGFVAVNMRTNCGYTLRRAEYDAVTTAIRDGQQYFEGEDQYGAPAFIVLRPGGKDTECAVESVFEMTPAALEAQIEDQKTIKQREVIE